jgi:hypothetical protein
MQAESHMGPEIAIHREVQIRYGYNVVDDRYYAHFELPEKRLSDSVRNGYSMTFAHTGLVAGKQRPMSANTAEDVLKQVRSTIDSYFGD